MKKETFYSKSTGLENENKRQKRTIYALVVALCIVGADNFRMRITEKAIITPCGNPENAMWVGNSSISPEYMQAIGHDVLALALNVSPETVEQNDSEFLMYATPELRTYLVDDMNDAAQRIINNGISQAFYPDQWKVVLKTQTLYVNGYLKTFIGTQQTSNIQQLYKIKFKTSNMNVRISEFRQLDPKLDKAEMKDAGL